MASRSTIEKLRVRNYRVLRDVTFDQLTPLTVLLGPNGSGKSTVFDVFVFLHEAFTTNLRRAWDARNRMGEIRSRGATGPVEFELTYRADEDSRAVSYTLTIDEDDGNPVVVDESLRWATDESDAATQLLRFARGSGEVYDHTTGQAVAEALDGPDLLAVSTLGQLSRYQQVAELRRFITGWYLSHINSSDTRVLPESGPQERLSETGDNLPNVLQHLQERHPDRLEQIFTALRRRVPALERIEPEPLSDGRLLLRLKDQPFEQPISAKYISDGTLKLLAYLTVLHDPDPSAIIGIEEPENQLHPKLLAPLAEEARAAVGRSQMLVTTHSPHFADALQPEELWALYRDEDGFTQVTRASEIPGLVAMWDSGGKLGDLWMEGYLGLGGRGDVRLPGNPGRRAVRAGSVGRAGPPDRAGGGVRNP